MSGNFGSANPMQPLSIGNVVSAAIKLYRSHLKQYLGLAFQALLWAIIPIYGWAKFHSIQALLSRLAFSELVNQPEGIKAARHEINPKLWSFFLAQILVALILFGANLGISIVRGILIGVFGLAFGDQAAITILVIIVVNLIGLVAYLWVYSRIFIPELPLAVEDILDAGQAISRSWELTKGHVWRLQAIILVATIITMPLIVLAAIPFIIGIGSFMTAITLNPDTLPSSAALSTFFISLLVSIILFLLINIVVAPFWQAIKAVIYYDLRSRREGLGLRLRDYDI